MQSTNDNQLDLIVDCRCVCHFVPQSDLNCDCCEWANEKWFKT
jgi:hypothetical protein